MTSFSEYFCLKNLNDSFYQCIKNNHWKFSTQNYWENLLENNIKLHEDLINDNYIEQPKYCFGINERGKYRLIEAPTIRDRIVQKILSTKVLIPQLYPYLIYDNYASLKHRGTSQARQRTELVLRKWIRQYGDEGYIVLMDIHNFFGSIDHEILKSMLYGKLEVDDQTLRLIDYSIDISGPNGIGLNLGSECPQIYATFYPTQLDNWFKIVEGIHSYGRYMDDMKFIVLEKDRAEYLVDGAIDILKSLKLEMNEKKTQIIKLSHGFTYLQTKYDIDNGHLITRPTHKKIARERKKLVRYKDLVDTNRVSTYDVYLWYKGWRQSLLTDYNSCWDTVESMDDLFYSLFPKIQIPEKLTRTELIEKAFKEADYDTLRYGWE